MPIKITCECGKSFAVKDSDAGKRGKCPACGGSIQVPAGNSPSKASPPSDRKAATPATSTTAVGGSVTDDLFADAGIAGRSASGRRCPECEAEMAQEAVLCIECGYDANTGQRLAANTDSQREAEREKRLRGREAKADKRGKTPGEPGASATKQEKKTSQAQAIFPVVTAIAGVQMYLNPPIGPATWTVSLGFLFIGLAGTLWMSLRR